MRRRIAAIILLFSLGGNVLLVWLWLGSTRPTTVVHFGTSPRPPLVTNLLRPIRTNLVVHSRLLTWQDIESSDFPTFIRNLRLVGCPEATIRDIVVSEVDELFARRRATNSVSASQQWWRATPDPDVTERAQARRDALENERRALLTELLGPQWDSGLAAIETPGSPVILDGPILGELSPDTQRALREIERDSRESLRAYRAAMQESGRRVDPAEVAEMERHTREELAKLLTPAQFEEYQLRYSATASQLRRGLNGFDPTPEEFRRMFGSTEALTQQIDELGSSTDPATTQRRDDWEHKRDLALREALGTERYEYYRLSQDPTFRRAREAAEELGASPETAVGLYQISRETDAERQRILADAALSVDEQSKRLASVDQERLTALRKLLGEERFRRFQTAASP